MKKVIMLLMLVFLLSGCDDKNELIGLKEGDIRTTETEHYIYVERCAGFNGLDIPFWEYVKIINKDSIK